MDLAKGMAETVAAEIPSPAQIAANRWQPERELASVKAPNMRAPDSGRLAMVPLRHLRRIHPPNSNLFRPQLSTCRLALSTGKQDWGTYQRPGVFETMRDDGVHDMLGAHLIDGAGHWVQQEQPEEVSRLLLEFLKRAGA